MKVVILAGGLGTRLSEYTKVIPKPMVKIGKSPILKHIMKCFYSYGFKEFIIATGYKRKIIEDYFKESLKKDKELSKCSVKLVNTGRNTLTGGRIKRLKDFIEGENFFMTYGDGVANVDLIKLRDFHNSHKKTATVTAVRPIPRFGALEIEENLVRSFSEKDKVKEGWINGGFFVFNKKIFDYLPDDQTILEREPLEKLSKERNLLAYKHEGFWHCMDTIRDKEFLDKLSNIKGSPPWHIPSL